MAAGMSISSPNLMSVVATLNMGTLDTHPLNLTMQFPTTKVYVAPSESSVGASNFTDTSNR